MRNVKICAAIIFVWARAHYEVHNWTSRRGAHKLWVRPINRTHKTKTRVQTNENDLCENRLLWLNFGFALRKRWENVASHVHLHGQSTWQRIHSPCNHGCNATNYQEKMQMILLFRNKNNWTEPRFRIRIKLTDKKYIKSHNITTHRS